MASRPAALATVLPDDIKTEMISDQSRFIPNTIDDVKQHPLLAAALVSGWILLFIRDWRTTVIATLAIPISIVGTLALTYLLGLMLNSITKLGLGHQPGQRGGRFSRKARIPS